MTKTYSCNIRAFAPPDPRTLQVVTGRSLVIVGANGSGKTRLAVHLENALPADAVHRIAAQKSLTMHDQVSLISFERAEQALRYGYPDSVGSRHHKLGHRWGSKPAIHQLNDFEALLQTLFAEQNRIAVQHLHARRANLDAPLPTTKLAALKELWEGLLPHRELRLQDASITVLPRRINTGATSSTPAPSATAFDPVSYPGSEMSDGERAIFYFLGQCLLAPTNGVIIIDEPENHVHKAILGRLWDAIEAARPDCAFVYITHDLDFAATRTASAKYFLRAYDAADGGRWDLEELPDDTGLPEHVITELVGSRKPILFVEGTGDSLDLAIYRSQYSGFTIVPIGSCEDVIHSVGSYRRSAALHRLGLMRGLVDADDRDAAEIAYLRERDVYVLPVAEVENLLLLPDVFLAMAEAFFCSDPPARLAALKDDIISSARNDLEVVCTRYTMRRLDRKLKRITVDAKDRTTLRARFTSELAHVDPSTIFSHIEAKLQQCIRSGDLEGLLALYDNKGLLARAAVRLGLGNRKELQDKVSRLLGGPNGSKLRDELAKVLPNIPV